MLKSNSPVNFSRMKAECLWIPACLCTWGMLVSWDNHTPCHVFCFTWTQNCHRNAYKHFLFSSPAHVAHTWGLLAAGLASAGKGETLPAWKAVPFMWVKSSQSPTVFMACLRTALKTSTSTENSETWGEVNYSRDSNRAPSVFQWGLWSRDPSPVPVSSEVYPGDCWVCICSISAGQCLGTAGGPSELRLMARPLLLLC